MAANRAAHLHAGGAHVEHLVDVRAGDDAAGTDHGDVDRVDDLAAAGRASSSVRAEMAAGLDALDDDGRGAELLGELRDARATRRSGTIGHAGLPAPLEDVAREAGAGDDEVDALGDRGLDELLELARPRP